MQISRNDILHIAELARLRLTEEEIVKFEAELPRIFDFIAALQSLATDSAEEFPAVPAFTNAFRADLDGVIPIGNPDDLREAFLAYDKDGYLAVPPIFNRSRGAPEDSK